MALKADSLSLILTIFFICILIPLSCSIDFDYPAVFNFGDSNSDTGDLVAGVGDHLDPPNGQIYFKKPSGRFCDGRLIIDFLMDAMDMPFLNAYLDAVGAPSFRTGCNFAAAGSTILPATASSVSPFSFGIQVAQFLRFKDRVLELHAKSRRLNKYIPDVDFFGRGLYIFDIGQNDLAGAFYSKSFDQVVASIPTILAEFEAGIKNLYDEGTRKFWIHNTGPLGCLAQNVAKFGTDPSKLDAQGCVSMHNQAAKLFNLQLHALCGKLQAQYSDANITYIDIFTIKSNLISNYSRYGKPLGSGKSNSVFVRYMNHFVQWLCSILPNETEGWQFLPMPMMDAANDFDTLLKTAGFEQPIMACCGYGGPPLNYNSQIVCGQTKIMNGSSVTANACSDSTEYVNWDGIHYTEAANQHIASQILTGKYSDPPFSDNMPFLLKLNI